MQHRNALEIIWRAGVSQVEGHACVSNALRAGEKYDRILAVGKAATPMLEAALAHCGYDTKALLVTKYNHVKTRHKFNQDKLAEYCSDGTLQIIEAAHPIPDENSLKAGLALKQFVNSAPSDTRLLMLVSGGASSLAEHLTAEFDLAELQRLTSKMLADGSDIDAINQQRKRMSQIKDGKLLAEFSSSSVDVLEISDVSGDNISVIGSGIGMITRVNNEVKACVEVIANNDIARSASEKKAQLLGFEVIANTLLPCIDAHEIAANIYDVVSSGEPGIYIFGGEPTLSLPKNPGRGGRNQHLALLLAQRFCGSPTVEFLIAGTDGSDGPTDAAGGFGDGTSFTREPGASQALANADAGSYLENSGDLFVTGPTGTNVMDLMVIFKQ